MAGSLRSLRLHDSLCQTTIWASGLPTLRRLVLTSSRGPLSWDAPPQALPALEELTLSGFPLNLPPRPCLPSTLTALHLDGHHQAGSLPSQMTALTRLRSLSLAGAEYASSGYSALPFLPSLHQLVVHDCDNLPACLSELTRLEHLTVDDMDGRLKFGEQNGAGIIAAALPQLQQLTYLALDSTPHGFAIPIPPPELATLSNLQSFFWLDVWGLALPAGTWLSSLRRCAAVAQTWIESLPALAAATRLELMGMYCDKDTDSDALASALPMLAHLPALRRLVLAGEKGWDLYGVPTRTLRDVQRRSPGLRIECLDCHWDEFVILCGYTRFASPSHDAFIV